MKLFTRSLIVIFIMLAASTYSIAENRPAGEVETLTQLMQAISQNDYKAFIASGNAQFKSGITKQAFESVVNQVGSIIRGGYKATYLTELYQQGNKVPVWKISYEKNSDDMLAKLVLIDNKVAGFWLQ